MPSVLIRPAIPADIAAITAIYRANVLGGTASYEIEPPDEAEMAARFMQVRQAGYPWLVAERQGAMAGYAYASAFRTRPAYRWLVEDSVYVDERHQGLGVGSALLAELLNLCTASGYRQMIAVIGGSHPPSIALHVRLGFAPCGRIEASGFKLGRWLDTTLMQKALGPGGAEPPGPVTRSIG